MRKPKNGFFFGFQKLDQRQIVGVGSGNGDDVVILHFVEHSQHQAKIRDVFAFINGVNLWTVRPKLTAIVFQVWILASFPKAALDRII